MKPAPIHSPVYTPAMAQPNAPTGKGASAVGNTLGDVTNQAHAAGPPKGGALGRMANAIAGIRDAFKGPHNPSANRGSGPSISTPKDGGAATAVLASNSQDLCVEVAADVFSNASAKLTPLLYGSSPSLDDSVEFAKAFQTLASGLHMLDKQVLDSSGQSRRLFDVSATLAGQVKDLLAMPMAKGDAAGIWGRVNGGENVLANGRTCIDLMHYLDDVKNVMTSFAQETGNTAVAVQAKYLFQDPLARELLDRLGTSAYPTDQFEELLGSGNYCKFGSDVAGVRYKNIPVVPVGKDYMAHRMFTPQGREIGFALNYPKPDDMPQYLQVLAKSPPQRLLVLASRDEIDSQGLPPYFSTDGVYGNAKCGEYHVTSERRDDTNYGPLTIRQYDMTVYPPNGDGFHFAVHHVLNWPDQTSVPAEALMEFSADLLADGGIAGTVAHCKAGVGRTGVALGTFAMMAYGISAEEVISGMRATRSPYMVQTNAQLETLVKVQRELEFQRAAIDAPHGASRAAPAEDRVYANRISQFCVDTSVADGEPIYQNVVPKQAGAYENWSPQWGGKR
jgi:hypothetical protein